MKNTLLQWELDWIDANKNLYDGEYHIKAVKNNIKRRYLINKTKEYRKRIWAVFYVTTNWRVRQRLPRITKLAEKIGLI